MPRRLKSPARDNSCLSRLIAACAALFLCSCTIGTLTKPGLTDAEFKKDMYECDRDARMSGLGTGLASVGMRLQCMEARGYVEVH